MTIKFEFNTRANKTSTFFSMQDKQEKFVSFKKIIDDSKNGFFHFSDNLNSIESVKKLCEKFKNKKHFVQIGIGGSALGPEMLISALRKDHHKSFTILDNIDSDYIYDELAKIDLTQSLFYVVSKSGGTAETIACFSIVQNMLLKKGIKQEELKNYFVFCTDPSSGQLRTYVIENNYDSLEVPSNIGGRFSVLTHVGLFPAAFLGIDIKKLLEGANKIKSEILSENLEENILMQNAAHLAALYFQEKISVNETVLMPYSSKLKSFSAWFVQLWAESLGKASDSFDTPQGFTPVAAYGATDQHSQMQLFMEGPYNKLLYLIHIEKSQQDFDLTSNINMQSAQKLNSKSLNDLMHAEFFGTKQALIENKRNVIEISLSTLNEETLGALILFYESLTALMGEYLKVDPFNQPGVEKGKIFAFEYLKNS